MIFKGLFNTRNALKNAGEDSLLVPVSDAQRESIQHELLEMYTDILSYCRKHNIIPFLVGGSALGAVRHNGFIPWDDDLDIGMVRSHYDYFVKGFKKCYATKYLVNSAGRDNNAKTRFTLVIKKGTICRELFSPPDDRLNGIKIDVFPIDNVPNNRFIRMIKGVHCNSIEFVAAQVYYKENATKDEIDLLKRTGTINYLIRAIIGKMFSWRKSAEWNNKLDKYERWYDNKSKQCSIVPGRKHYFGETINRSVIFPARYVDFCNLKAPVFNNVEEYLENLYGTDYMKVPRKNKRERHLVKELYFGG